MERYRVRYSKVGRLRFISHLDIIQYFSRMVVRAQLPVSLTQGFNPKVKFEFGPALAMGFTSRAEYLHLHLEEALPADEVKAILQEQGIEGLAVLSVEQAPAQKLSRAMVGYVYRVELTAADPAELDFLDGLTVAVLEETGLLTPGTLESVTVLEKDPGSAVLRWVTRLVQGRVADPRVLVKSRPEAGIEIECHKEDCLWSEPETPSLPQ